jgi:hypothetical protein
VTSRRFVIFAADQIKFSESECRLNAETATVGGSTWIQPIYLTAYFSSTSSLARWHFLSTLCLGLSKASKIKLHSGSAGRGNVAGALLGPLAPIVKVV